MFNDAVHDIIRTVFNTAARGIAKTALVFQNGGIVSHKLPRQNLRRRRSSTDISSDISPVCSSTAIYFSNFCTKY